MSKEQQDDLLDRIVRYQAARSESRPLKAKHKPSRPTPQRASVEDWEVLDRLYGCQGICLDEEEWEFVYVAKQICQLFGIAVPSEWDELCEGR